MATDNVALQMHKEIADAGDGVATLSTGVRARFHAVSASLVEAVGARIKDPEPPTFHNPNTDKDEPNPLHPDYVAALDAARRERIQAGLDVIYDFGVELADPVPPVETWLPRLRRHGIDFDAGDPLAVDFYYKKYVAVGAQDLDEAARRSGLQRAEVQAAEESFKSPA